MNNFHFTIFRYPRVHPFQKVHKLWAVKCHFITYVLSEVDYFFARFSDINRNLFTEPCENDLMGDGFCHKINDFFECDFDGGDCNFNECESFEWISDGYCDDENNNLECHFDGGDCCWQGSGSQYAFCSDCECLNPSKKINFQAQVACSATACASCFYIFLCCCLSYSNIQGVT